MALTDAQKIKLIRLEQLEVFKQQADLIYYQKPEGGIPSTDLASAVQTALAAAGTALQAADLDTLNGKVAALEALIEADQDEAINKFNEIVAFLAGITDTNTLEGILNGINTNISAKYTKPSGGIPATDLADAVQTSLGKADTALQAADIDGKANKSEMSVSTNGDETTITLKTGTAATVINAHQDISGKQDVISDLSDIRAGAALGATSIQFHQDISGKADKSEMSVTVGNGSNGVATGKTAIQLKSGTSATVISGDYATNAEVQSLFGSGE